MEPWELCFILIINWFQILENAESDGTAACLYFQLGLKWYAQSWIGLNAANLQFFFFLSEAFLFFWSSGVGSLQRTPSQRSTMIYQRNNYALNTAATYADPYRSAQYRPSDPNCARQAVVVDDGATRSPSIDSIQKDPR